MSKDTWGGLVVVIAGLVVLLATFLVAAFHYHTAGDVSTALAAITGTIGTVVGAYFGVQAGSSSGQKAAALADNARADAEAGRQQAEALSVRMAAAADPDRAATILSIFDSPGLAITPEPSGSSQSSGSPETAPG